MRKIDKDEAIHLYNSGWSQAQIAKRYNVKEPSVSEAFTKWGVVRREIDLQPCGTEAAYNRGCRCEDCRQAQAIAQKARFDERMNLIADIKLAAGCMDCGYSTCACALEFDHRPGELKLFAISKNPMAAMPDLSQPFPQMGTLELGQWGVGGPGAPHLRTKATLRASDAPLLQPSEKRILTF